MDINLPVKVSDLKLNKNKYDNNRPLNIHRYSSDLRVNRAIRELCERIGYKGTLAERQAKVLVLDLYHCYKGDKTRYIKFYRSPNSYENIKKYNWFKISYNVVRNLTDKLSEHEYIEYKRGTNNKITKHNESSKMKATPKLIHFLEKEHQICLKHISTWRDEELIILKSKKRRVKTSSGKFIKIKSKMNYEDTKVVIQMRKNLQDYNELLKKTYIDIDIQGYKYYRKVKKSDINRKNKKVPLYVDLSRKQVKRVFTENFEHGGRFYGGFWQGCPEDLRQRIIINGEHVVEFDFSGLHVHLLYALKGLKLGDKEPYINPKHDDPHKLRRIYKLLLLTSVNCKSDVECLIAVEDQLVNEMEEEPDKYPETMPELEPMLHELKQHHGPIRSFINKETGLELQNIDSKIAEAVISNMTNSGIPVLCVHDSFICRYSDADIVHRCMKEAYLTKVTDILITREIKIDLTLEEIFTTECKESENIFPSFRRTYSIAKLLTWKLLGISFAERYLKYLRTNEPSINKVEKISPIILEI